MSVGPIPDRPNRPLVVKCGYENSTRRVTFPSASTCRLESLRSRVSECFHLSASPFFLCYTDDDGEEFPIHTESDYTEAIAYFVSGDDEANVSTYSGASGGIAGRGPLSTQKITIRVEVVVEYDGPSLSDTSSISSFSMGSGMGGEDGQDGMSRASGSGGSWRSSGYSESLSLGTTSSRRDGSRFRNVYEDEEDEGEGTEYGEPDLERHDGAFVDSIEDLSLSPRDAGSTGHGTRPPSERTGGSSSAHSTSRGPPRLPSRQSSGDTALQLAPTGPLTGPESAPAPSLLTHSELGSRWLREQSKLATTRRLGPGLTPSSRRNDSDEDSIGSDEESLGDLALVRDARGKFYYSYQTNDDITLSSTVDYDDDAPGPSRRVRPMSSFSSATTSPPRTPTDHTTHEIPRLVEPAGPPILAPDCSACGIRLDYMRYVCQTCGDGEMWKENAPGKAAFIPRIPSESRSESDGSEETAARSNGSETVYGEQNETRSRSGSMSTNASRGSGTRGPGSPRQTHDDLEGPGGLDRPQRSGSLPRGYELCVGCIEVHGIAHAKAAAKEARKLGGAEVRRRRRQGELRHTFRERIWGVQGWVDVEYSEDTNCTICKTMLINNRYKCVSCPKFDLCRSCYQKVEEIHPAHAFLSLPDQELQDIGPSNAGRGRDIVERRPMRHPGAFCHNCLQDIVGPRFHCAVCPSWDLCIQCEGLAGVGEGSGHKPDHIMMKIPLPIATNEVEAVSRRARDRWFQQDSNTVAAASTHSPLIGAPSSRSSSPTNETVYAGATGQGQGQAQTGHAGQAGQAGQVVNITTRDALDHGVRCNNCNEWIMGRRYQCANCPSEPAAYNLCTICELRSYRIHDPRHLFFRLDRPVHIPLGSPRPLLPILYRGKVGDIPPTATPNPRDPTAYLSYVLHRETLCDIHGDQIRGAWLRCCHCPAGFDICQAAEGIADHDSTHVFVVFKARVDMGAFRQLADLSAAQPKPLLTRQVYLD